MNKPTSLALLALLTAVMPLSLTACQGGTDGGADKASTEDTASVGDEFDPFEDSPTEFDESKIVPDGTKSKDGQVVKDIKKQTLPVDPYLFEPTQSTTKAEQVFLNKCLKEKGVDLQLPSIKYTKTQKPKDPAINPKSGLIHFTPENAKKFGYFGAYLSYQDQTDPSMEKYFEAKNQISDDVWKEEVNEAGETEMVEDPEKASNPIYKAYTECEESMWEEAPFIYNVEEDGASEEAEEEFDFKEEMKKNASAALFVLNPSRTPQVKEAAKKWKECMKPEGIADLPDDPFHMPSESLGEKIFGNQEFSIGFKPTLTDEHIAVAVKDAQCRESSGYNQIYYDAHWVLLDEFVYTNAKDLRQALETFENQEKKREEFILTNE